MPISQPPIGRIRKPTAQIAAVLSSCAVVSPWGKNDLAKYSENAAYTYQSYHSTILPTDPLKIDFKRLRGVFSMVGAAADPLGIAFGVTITDPSVVIFSGAHKSAA